MNHSNFFIFILLFNLIFFFLQTWTKQAFWLFYSWVVKFYMRSHGLVHVSYFAKSWCSCINNELNLCLALSISFFIWSENNFISIVPVWPIEMGQRKMGCERVDPPMLFSEELPSKFLASKWGFECLTVLINSEKKSRRKWNCLTAALHIKVSMPVNRCYWSATFNLFS